MSTSGEQSLGDVPASHLLHSGYSNDTLRHWQTTGNEMHPWNFVQPVFISDDEQTDKRVPIGSLPGVFRYNMEGLVLDLAEWVQDGLTAVLLFGVVSASRKDATGSYAVSDGSPVVRATALIREKYPGVTVICDVCLCGYTSHGHCGVLRDDGSVNNEASLHKLAEQALAYAKAGAQVVAPSDMMDGRVSSIKSLLRQHGKAGTVAVLSYSVKFASNFYGPFRDAAGSAPAFGDRRCYQLPSGATGLAQRAAARDVAEGADMIMVKPGMPYLGVMRTIKNSFPSHPMFVYQVSGEYAMLYHAAAAGTFSLRKTLMQEVFPVMREAGADVIISYYTPQVLKWIKEDQK